MPRRPRQRRFQCEIKLVPSQTPHFGRFHRSVDLGISNQTYSILWYPSMHSLKTRFVPLQVHCPPILLTFQAEDFLGHSIEYRLKGGVAGISDQSSLSG